jgi:hypothetical protein
MYIFFSSIEQEKKKMRYTEPEFWNTTWTIQLDDDYTQNICIKHLQFCCFAEDYWLRLNMPVICHGQNENKSKTLCLEQSTRDKVIWKNQNEEEILWIRSSPYVSLVNIYILLILLRCHSHVVGC